MLIKENSLVVFNMAENQLNLNFEFGNLQVLNGGVMVNGKDASSRHQAESDAEKLAAAELKRLAAEKAQREKLKKQLQAAKLVPPIIISPESGYVHINEKTEDGPWKGPRTFKVRWTHGRPDTQFEIQYSADSEFKEILKSLKLKSLQTTTPDFKAGIYFARIRELSPNPNLTSTWTAPLNFKVEDLAFDPHIPGPILVEQKIKYSTPNDEPPTFKWKPVGKAAQYIFEVSATPDFQQTSSTFTKKPEYRWKKFVKGKFYYRVFGATRKGTRGDPSLTGEIRIDFEKPVLVPIAPLVIQGKDPDDVGKPQEFGLKWSHIPIVEKYQVQVSRDEHFKQPTQFETRGPASVVTVPNPGQYLVRVRPLSSTGEPLTGFSVPTKIDYIFRPPLATPKLVEPLENMTLFFQKNDSRVFWMEWKTVKNADKYSVQIATDKSFNHIILEQSAKKPRYLVQSLLPQGKLYWRVRAEGEGRNSFWSAPRRMKVFAGKTAELYQKDSD